jgi:hypothetical protein
MEYDEKRRVTVMGNPRNIVRASITALVAAVFVSSAIGVQADVGDTVSPEDMNTPTGVEAPSPARISSTVMAMRSTATAIQAATPMHREYRAAVSKDARSLKGFKPSLYRGRHFSKSDESLRKCIITRESRAVYSVTGGGNLDGIPGGDYQGAYQMSPDLARGVTYMMAKESKKTNDGLLSEVRSLRDVPASEWSRYWQDRAFYTILNYENSRSGAKHWFSTSHKC